MKQYNVVLCKEENGLDVKLEEHIVFAIGDEDAKETLTNALEEFGLISEDED